MVDQSDSNKIRNAFTKAVGNVTPGVIKDKSNNIRTGRITKVSADTKTVSVDIVGSSQQLTGISLPTHLEIVNVGDLVVIVSNDSRIQGGNFILGTYASLGQTSDAIHDNVSNEIKGIELKASPDNTDFLIIEDSADNNKKKSILLSALPGGGGEKGDTGTTGATGVQGNDGDTGVGNTGVDGDTGAGVQGDTGADSTVQGDTGVGDQGDTGIGDQGDTGIGDQGDTGADSTVQGDTGDDGDTGTNYPWEGAWLTATAYALNETVENDGSGYVCILAHTSGDEDDEPGVGADWETYWGLFVEKGDTGVGDSLVAFSAYRSSSITINGFTKITANTEVYDEGSNYDNVTNYRFVAPEDGVYHFEGAVHILNMTSTQKIIASLYKNGTEFKRGVEMLPGSTSNLGVNVSADILLNATDYVELFGFSSSSKTLNVASKLSYFMGHLVGTT